jgi:hypothetical protein
VAPAKGLRLHHVEYPAAVDDPSRLLYPDLLHDEFGRLQMHIPNGGGSRISARSASPSASMEEQDGEGQGAAAGGRAPAKRKGWWWYWNQDTGAWVTGS